MEFIRFAGTINTHEEKKVAKATVNVILENCTGTFYITDIMFQEGKWLTGYVVNNLELLQKNRVDGEITPVRFFNGIVRSGVTAVITNDGEVSAGLNYHIIPKDTMAAGDMSVAHNYGSHKLTLQSFFWKMMLLKLMLMQGWQQGMEAGLGLMDFILIRQQGTVNIRLK